MKGRSIHVHWLGPGTRGTESKIKLVGDRCTTDCATVSVMCACGRCPITAGQRTVQGAGAKSGGQRATSGSEQITS